MSDDSISQNASSLDDLSQAFAKAMGRQQPTPAVVDEAAGPQQPETAVASEDDVPVSPETILEAILFVGHPENEATPIHAVVRLLRGVEVEDVHQLVAALNEKYQSSGIPFAIQAAGDGYRMQLDDAFHQIRERFYGRIRRARLSQRAIDVLAVVAYNQPVTREEVDELLGAAESTGRILRQLVRRELLQKRPSEGTPRRQEYVTSDRFLELFQLRHLEDLPRSDDPQ